MPIFASGVTSTSKFASARTLAVKRGSSPAELLVLLVSIAAVAVIRRQPTFSWSLDIFYKISYLNLDEHHVCVAENRVHTF